jgi:hypothetical protein
MKWEVVGFAFSHLRKPERAIALTLAQRRSMFAQIGEARMTLKASSRPHGSTYVAEN